MPTLTVNATTRAAAASIDAGNNGYADFPHLDATTVADLTALGYVLLRRPSVSPRAWRGFTRAAQAALAAEHGAGQRFAVRRGPTAPTTDTLDPPDYEAAILADQSRHLIGA